LGYLLGANNRVLAAKNKASRTAVKVHYDNNEELRIKAVKAVKVLKECDSLKAIVNRNPFIKELKAYGNADKKSFLDKLNNIVDNMCNDPQMQKNSIYERQKILTTLLEGIKLEYDNEMQNLRDLDAVHRPWGDDW
jgi:hypothetical protein